jgi:hypothetical protein
MKAAEDLVDGLLSGSEIRRRLDLRDGEDARG